MRKLKAFNRQTDGLPARRQSETSNCRPQKMPANVSWWHWVWRVAAVTVAALALGFGRNDGPSA